MADLLPEAARPLRRGLLRRFAVFIGAATLLVTVGAVGYAKTQQPTYTGVTRVLVEPLTVPAAAPPVVNMQTEQIVAGSDVVIEPAAATLHRNAAAVAAATSVSVPVGTNVLVFGFQDSSPSAAARGATAVAHAYLTYRNSAASLHQGARHLGTPPLRARIITPATRPASPSSPDLIVDVIVGLIAGLVLGVLLALGSDAAAVRIRTPLRWSEVTSLPVLAVPSITERRLPPTARLADIGGDAEMSRARVQVSRTLPGASGVIAVVGPAAPGLVNAVARQLAAAFARSDVPTTYIAVEPAESGGDSEAARVHVSTSGPGRGDDDQEHAAMRLGELLAAIRGARAHSVVVIVAAPGRGADVLPVEVAAHADAAVVVDDLRTARRRVIAHFMATFAATGTAISGAVLLGRRRSALPPPNAASTHTRASAPTADREVEAEPDPLTIEPIG